MTGRKLLWAAAVAVAGSAAPADAAVIAVLVDSHAGPWLYAAGGLNDAYQYGVGDHAGPTVVSAADGFDFAPGGLFTITYSSGTTNAFLPFDPILNVDANGYPGFPANDGPGSSGAFFPSKFIDPAQYPANLNALVGAFTDASGAIVGTPFLVGNGPYTVAAPAGAVRLQLGINDDIFGDNTGALEVMVSGPSGPAAVPEPSALALLAAGGLGLAVRRRLARG